MATAPPRPRRNLEESHRRVRHPLQKLRGYIRFYVSVEGVTLLLSVLAVWFWASLLLDYESFALFHLDWVETLPVSVRGLFLGAVFAATAALVTAGLFLPLSRLAGSIAAVVGALAGLAIGWWFGGWMSGIFVALFGALLGGGLVMAMVTAVSLLLRGWWYAAVGLPLLLVYLAGWFALGVLAGGGLGPWITALVMLVVLLLGPIVAVELKRLLVDFHDNALALVLERRYPKELGDRLITAVELANLNEAARYGYSPAMIEQTIHDAADRVEPLPVQQVFDWKRLFWQAAWVVLLTVGIYLLVLAGFCAVDSVRQQRLSLAGVGRFHDVASIWFERNVLLEDTLWPRQAYLELVGFPANGELRIPENTQPPPVVARAYRWVIADKTSPRGWRPLRWGDLGPELIGTNPPPPMGEEGGLLAALAGAPSATFPANLPWAALAGDPLSRGLPVDDISLRVDQFAVRKGKSGGQAKWEIKEPEGWRPLLWKDLTRDALGGRGVPPLPADWQPACRAAVAQVLQGLGGVPPLPANWPPLPAGSYETSFTFDEVESRLNSAEAVAGLDEQRLAYLRRVLAHVEHQAALGETLDSLKTVVEQPRRSRTLRLLPVPESVIARYRGKDTRGEISSGREPGNQFTIHFPVLKEPVSFHVRGEDFYTPERQITTVPPPNLIDLYRDERRPAYIYYRLPSGEDPVAVLKGAKQLFRNQGVSRVGGETSRFDVHAGTDVVLAGKTDKLLQNVEVRARQGSIPFDKRQADLVEPNEDGHSKTFQVEFTNVRPTKDRVPGKPPTIDFDLIFTDTDNVTSQRNVVIKPVDDETPTASLEIAVVRKSPRGPYLITPRAFIPFKGKTGDDHGLDRVNYVYTLAPEEKKEEEQGGKAILFLTLLGLNAGRSPQETLAMVPLASLLAERKGPDPTADVRRMPVTSFEAELARRKADFLPVPEILQRMNETSEETARRLKEQRQWRQELPEILEWLRDQPPERKPLRDYALQPEEGGTPFDLEDLAKRGDDRIKIAPTTGIQQRYQMQVWLEAFDNDIETGPNRGRSKDTFNFLVISEEELRLEIYQEEERLRIRMQEMFGKLRGPGSVEAKLVTLMNDLSAPGLKPDAREGGFSSLITQTGLLHKEVEKFLDETSKVHLEYARILQELKVNRIQPSKIDQVEKRIIEPLGRLIRGDKVKLAMMEEREVGFPPASRSLTRLGQGMNSSLEKLTGAPGSTDVPQMIAEARTDAQEARDRVKDLADALHVVIQEMVDIIGYDAALKLGLKLLHGVLDQEMSLRRWEAWLKKKIIDDLLKEPDKPKEVKN